MNTIRRICVYCGSSTGFDPAHVEAAEQLGRWLGENAIGLAYGGGRVGLMGALADAVLAAGGEVVGVIPHHLLKLEVGHRGVTSLVAVDTMHARKHHMAELADAFVALPGGIGTAEELLEVFTWLQLGLHAKPVALLNTRGYYRHLIQLLDHMVAAGFLKEAHRSMLLVEEEWEPLWRRLQVFSPHSTDKRVTAIE